MKGYLTKTLKHVRDKNHDEEENSGIPYVIGTATEWEFRKPLRVQDYCRQIDKDYVDPMEFLKNLDKIR